jgi:acetolactate synthase I/III small subunit
MASTPHHTLSALVENKAGVLARIVNLFSRRGYNIYSLAVAPTDDDTLSRVTVVVDAESAPMEQIVKQLHKLVNVVKITEHHPGTCVERELVVATVRADPEKRAQVAEVTRIFEGRIVAVSHDSLTVSLEGHPSKVDDFEELLRPFGIAELQRTGRVALPKLEREAPRLRSVKGKVS